MLLWTVLCLLQTLWTSEWFTSIWCMMMSPCSTSCLLFLPDEMCVCVCVCVCGCVCLCLCLCVCVCVCSLRVTGQCVFRAEIEQYDPNQWLALWEMFLWNCTGASIMLLYHWPLCWGWEWRDDSGTDLKTESPPGLCACGPPLYILSLGLHLHVMLMVGGLSGVRLKNTSFV